ncbi:hypothetical protein D3C85_1736960 [compost metagenome]
MERNKLRHSLHCFDDEDVWIVNSTLIINEVEEIRYPTKFINLAVKLVGEKN